MAETRHDCTDICDQGSVFPLMYPPQIERASFLISAYYYLGSEVVVANNSDSKRFQELGANTSSMISMGSNLMPHILSRTQPLRQSLPLTNPATIENRVTEDEWTPGDKTVTSAVESLHPFPNTVSEPFTWCA